MARTKYKLGQMIQSKDASGVISELHIKASDNEIGHTTEYAVGDGAMVAEDDVTAVFVPRATRKAKVASITSAVSKKTKKSA